jgi:hypothetical protein
MTVRWPAAGLSLLDPRLLWATIALVVALLIGAAVIAWADRWRKNADRGVLSPGEQLAAFRLSYERGEVSQEEYERIRARLAPQIRGSGPGVRGPAEKPPAPSAEPGAPNPEPHQQPPDDPQPTT